jgi:hypothetical protein
VQYFFEVLRRRREKPG